MTSASSQSLRLDQRICTIVINERYEHGSILLTSNRAPNEWADLFMDPLLASPGWIVYWDRAEVIIISRSQLPHSRPQSLLEEGGLFFGGGTVGKKDLGKISPFCSFGKKKKGAI